ncbi:hypothetical protein AVEN_39283-1 [Araneus ventricosus]|uniref:Uncharacterized protein n=1 Tax=Araneus ventricosus TaxID=182803 RepID=A0A4Y2Q3D6_ARAVE|nr:hypothetical protein AVEN_39283-1 [Araneus ventricosus]
MSYLFSYKIPNEFSALSGFESSTDCFPAHQNQPVNGIGVLTELHTPLLKKICTKFFQKQGMKFIKESISMTFALGHSSNSQVLTTQVNVQSNT